MYRAVMLDRRRFLHAAVVGLAGAALPTHRLLAHDADEDGAGFAHEVIEFAGQCYMSGVVGRDGRFKLKFTPIEWTADALTLANY